MKHSDLTNTAQAFEAIRDALDLSLQAKGGNGLPNLLQIRTILELGIAAIAAETATGDDIEAMQKAITALDGEVSAVDHFIKADRSFHLVLAKATQNSFVPVLLNSIMELAQEQNGHRIPVNGDVVRERTEHQRILEAIRQRNPEAARQTMMDHLQQLLKA